MFDIFCKEKKLCIWLTCSFTRNPEIPNLFEWQLSNFCMLLDQITTEFGDSSSKLGSFTSRIDKLSRNTALLGWIKHTISRYAIDIIM